MREETISLSLSDDNGAEHKVVFRKGIYDSNLWIAEIGELYAKILIRKTQRRYAGTLKDIFEWHSYQREDEYEKEELIAEDLDYSFEKAAQSAMFSLEKKSVPSIPLAAQHLPLVKSEVAVSLGARSQKQEMNESLFDLRTIYNEGKTMEFTEDYTKQVIKEELTKIVKEGEIVDLHPDPFPEIPDSEISRQDKRKLADAALDYDLGSEVDDLEWNISNILNNRGEILSKPELYNWLKETHSFEYPQAFDMAIHNLLMSSEIFYNKKTKEYFGKQFADSFPSEKILPLSYYRKKTNPYNEGKTMEFTEDYTKQVIKEEYEALLDEKKKKPCKTAKGKRSAKIKKCKNPPCANALSRKKWKCRGSKSMK
jgi:hypothetical protein